MNFSSKYLEKAVEEISGLPGIGKKTALRLALHLLRQDEKDVSMLAQSLIALKEKVNQCSNCGNLSDTSICEICANPSRNSNLICVVEDIRDVMAIENTGQFRGLYHVLGGVISPMDGIGPSELNIDSLILRVSEKQPQEIIFGLGTTMEGETTTFYLYKKLAGFDLKLSAIARGIAVGDQLEYADEVTLARSIANRVPYESSLSQNQNP
jgi:recombination protein RecR